MINRHYLELVTVTGWKLLTYYSVYNYWTFDWCKWSPGMYLHAQQFLCKPPVWMSTNDFIFAVLDVYSYCSNFRVGRYNKTLNYDSGPTKETVSGVSSWPQCYAQLCIREHALSGPSWVMREQFDGGCGGAGTGAAAPTAAGSGGLVVVVVVVLPVLLLLMLVLVLWCSTQVL